MSIPRFWSGIRHKLQFLRWRLDNVWARRVPAAIRRLARFQGAAIPFIAVVAAIAVDSGLPPNLVPKVVGDLLTGAATLVGGFVTVAFAISVSLQQSVADLYSAQSLSGYSYGPRQKLTFFVLAASVFVCLGLGMYCGTLPAFGNSLTRGAYIVAGFACLGVALALLEWQLRHGADSLRPTAAINYLRDEALECIKRLDSTARRLGRRIELEHEGIEPAVAVARAYGMLGDAISTGVLQFLGRLQELAIRLSERGDWSAAAYALDAWTAVFVAYVERRRDCSVLVPSPVGPVILESDSQHVVDRALEQLNQLGERFVRNAQIPNARKVVAVYERLAKEAATIKYLNDSHQNPVVDQLSGYLGMLVEATYKQHMDIPYAAAGVQTRIGVLSVEAGYAYAPGGASKQLEALVSLSATSDRVIIIEECVKGFIQLIWAMLTTQKVRHHFRRITDSLERTHMVLGGLANAIGNDRMARAWVVHRQTFELLHNVIRAFPSGLSQIGEDDRRTARSGFLEWLDELHWFVRRAAEHGHERASYLDVLPALVVDAIDAITEVTRDQNESQFIEAARNWLYVLGWVLHDRKPLKDAKPLLDAAEASARIALRLAKRGAPPMESVKAVVSSMQGVIRHVAENHAPSYGYDELRVAVPLIYVVAFARTQGDAFLSLAAEKAIRDCEERYAKKFGERPPSSMLREVLSERDEFRQRDRTQHILHPLQAEAHELLRLEDLDGAILHLWGVVPDDSPIPRATRREPHQQ